MADLDDVVNWLLDSDPAIRWQVMRDLQDLPEDEWQAERARVETQGWGAQLLALEDEDGQWAGGAFAPAGFDWSEFQTVGQPWTATTWALTQLREFGLDPSTQIAQRAVALIGENSKWDHDGQPFWKGEVEECINGRNVADGVYFGVDMSGLVARLLTEQMADGGWNCESENGSTVGSFDTTINVLDGLLEFERGTGGTPEARAARARGQEYLLARKLYQRLSTGEAADADYLAFQHPNRWRYDILRALDYFRSASEFDGSEPDSRLGEAIQLVRDKRQPDGKWNLDRTPSGRTWFAIDEGVGERSRWITLRALRVLRWWDDRG